MSESRSVGCGFILAMLLTLNIMTLTIGLTLHDWRPMIILGAAVALLAGAALWQLYQDIR